VRRISRRCLVFSTRRPLLSTCNIQCDRQPTRIKLRLIADRCWPTLSRLARPRTDCAKVRCTTAMTIRKSLRFCCVAANAAFDKVLGGVQKNMVNIRSGADHVPKYRPVALALFLTKTLGRFAKHHRRKAFAARCSAKDRQSLAIYECR
jgi:hypothetical protein